MTLTRSMDRKVTNSVTGSGNPRIKNAFGLPSGKPFSCPGATSVCERICYAGKIEKRYKNVLRPLISNFEQLLYADYLGGRIAMAKLLIPMVEDFVRESNRFGAPLLFRIHWDGDFFSESYAEAWKLVIRSFPDVQFWVYTRSMFAVPILTGLPNLSLYISVDNDNISEANDYRDMANFATLADTFGEARGMGDRPSNCPELTGALPLISESGSACVSCGLCVFGRKDVAFSITRK